MRCSVVDIALDPRAAGSESVYTYRDDADLAIGSAVFVPIGSRTALGFVVGKREVTEDELGFPIAKLRSIHDQVDGLSLPTALIDLARHLAAETLCPLGAALSPAIPPGIQDRLAPTWSLVEDSIRQGLSVAQLEVVRTLEDENGVWVPPKSKPLEEGTLKALKALQAKGVVRHSLRFTETRQRKQSERVLRVTSEADRVERFLRDEGKRKPAQALTLMCLSGTEQGALTPAEIRVLAGVTESTVKALVEAGLLVSEDAQKRSGPHVLRELNAFQKLAFESIAEAVEQHEARRFLLFGVTGSGKTEVYLRAAGEALKAGRQVLYLVPEIALAAQAISQLRDRFGSSVAVLHSELSPSERLGNWIRIRSGEAAVIVGARSAIFAPSANLGLIVLDEEHEGSYKQENVPRYHAKMAAQFLAEWHNCPLVLGSATPSAESFYEAEQERITLLSLPVRAATAQLPEVILKDLTEGFRHGKPALLTPELHERMADVLAKGQQVILFLNRRAYAPFLVCRDCGHQIRCQECSVSLSYHRRDLRLKCHQCGHQERAPDVCPKCAGLRLSPLGIGTERVEEAISSHFPDAVVARLDRDMAAKKGAVEDVLARFRSGDIHVLVGTQMVAKGLDFPNVTLVGVIAADVSLNLPDFRASERTFQLLSQVAGRAGRGQIAGHVVVQTFNPEHPSVVSAQAHDFIRFYEALREERREAGYPPFSKLINITFVGAERRDVVTASDRSAVLLGPLRGSLKASILGPADCALERLQGLWRRHLLVKLPPGTSAKPVEEALTTLGLNGVQMTLDVDPYSMM